MGEGRPPRRGAAQTFCPRVTNLIVQHLPSITQPLHLQPGEHVSGQSEQDTGIGSRLSCTAMSPGPPRPHTILGCPERPTVPLVLQGCALHSPMGWSCRSLWVSQPHSYAKSCRDLGRAECDMFGLWTGLEAVWAVLVLPALPSLLVPVDPKATVPHTELSL